jgi:hypothetical protein
MDRKIQISDVLKKDLKVFGFLIVFGGVTVLTDKYLQVGYLSVLFGAAADYITFRITEELANVGYKRALSK